MKLKLSLVIFVILYFVGFISAQQDNNLDQQGNTVDTTVYKYSAWTSPTLKDDMTIDPDQNKQWRKDYINFRQKQKMQGK